MPGPYPPARTCHPAIAIAIAKAWLCSVLIFFAPGGRGQDTPAEEPLPIRDLGGAYAHLISFAAEPEISASRFKIDSNIDFDNEIDVLKLPLYKTFEVEGRDWEWYVQAAFSSLRYTEEGDVGATIGQSLNVDSEWRAYSGVGEVGIILPIGGGFSLAPGLGVGGSRLSNDTDIENTPLGNVLEEILERRFINWDTSAVFVRADLALLYREKWGSTKVRGGAHFIYSDVRSFNESTGFERFDAHNGSMSVKLDAAHPLPARLGDEPLFLVGHAAATAFVGSHRDDLGFSHFYELGVALGYRQIALGLQAVLGPDVDGLTLSLDYGF